VTAAASRTDGDERAIGHGAAIVRGETIEADAMRAKLAPLLRQLEDLEDRRAAGVITLPDGDRLEVGQLHKAFWPRLGLTKGALMRYYVRVSPYLLPVIADRPLITRRWPDGVGGSKFYQQRAPEDTPPGVRVATLASDRVVPRRFIGGSLTTLLFMTQIAAISQDPWFSRVQSEAHPDHSVLDLDPMPGVPFAVVRDAARWVHDELETLGAASFVKTSGATGIHVYVPLPPRTSWETSRLFAELVATTVAQRHPRAVTIERSIRARGSRVYLDFMQNTRGKTLASAYSARGTADAGVSTPLAWTEVERNVDRGDFTLRTIDARLREVGDRWAALRRAPGVNLAAVLSASERAAARRPRRRALRTAR
jgi:bifunctional non-homologous end joining protein LigD